MFEFAYRTTGLRWMHSLDIDDMREAIVDDDDGPDGGGAAEQISRPKRPESVRMRQVTRR